MTSSLYGDSPSEAYRLKEANARIAQLEAALAAVQVPEQVLHAAKQCILWDDPECSKVLMANFIIQLAGKDGGNGT